VSDVTYVLCALTSAVCAALLVRGWWASRERLLLWSALCFVGLAINNVLMVVDLVLYGAAHDLQVVRHVTAQVAMGVLLFGLVWERP
jgi:hypothetical protein